MNKLLLLLSIDLGYLLFAECVSLHFKQEDQDDVYLSYEPVRDPKLEEECRKKGEVAGRAKTSSSKCDPNCDDFTKIGPTRVCPSRPRERCFCPKGLFRKKYDGGKCVTEAECLNLPTTTINKFILSRTTMGPDRKIRY